MTFGGRANFHTKTLTFKIADFLGTYYAILGRPFYAKFMAIPNYTYLKLKMPRPHGIITFGGDLQQAHLCEWESYDIAITVCQPQGLDPDMTPLRGRGACDGHALQPRPWHVAGQATT
jgi:hypothetical protein